MDELIAPLEALVDKMRLLPGVGRKTAVKYAFSLLDMSDEEAEQFACALIEAKKRVGSCSVCGNICEGSVCPVCADPSRDTSVICAVENARDVIAIEKAHGYRGVYHVIGGTISPVDGRGPDKLHIASLLSRVSSGNVAEVIIATNATVEGETTAMYLSKVLKPLGVKTSRLAYGIPVGGDLEYADVVTLARAIEGRTSL